MGKLVILFNQKIGMAMVSAAGIFPPHPDSEQHQVNK